MASWEIPINGCFNGTIIRPACLVTLIVWDHSANQFIGRLRMEIYKFYQEPFSKEELSEINAHFGILDLKFPDIPAGDVYIPLRCGGCLGHNTLW